GTMSVETKYYLNDTELQEAEVLFHNKYEAKGEVELLAWKTLVGRVLKDDEFTFELLNEDGTEVLDTKKNSGGSDTATITFDKIKYDQTDIGKTYYYLVHEIKGSDETVIYDEGYFGYRVTVGDRYNNGILNVDYVFVKANVTVDDDGNITNVVYPLVEKDVLDEDGNVIGTEMVNEEVEMPQFFNGLEDGGLRIIKYISEDTPDYDPDQEFVFHVKLTDKSIKEGDVIEYEIVAAPDRTGNAEPAPAPAPDDVPETDESEEENETVPSVAGENLPLLSDPIGLIIPAERFGNTGPQKEIYHAEEEDLPQGSIGYAVYNANDKELIFIRSYNAYTDGQSYDTVYDIDNNVYSGTVFLAESKDRSSAFNVNVETVRMVHTIQPAKTTANWFKSCSNLTSIDLSKLDTQNVMNMKSMFEGCYKLTSLDVTGFDTQGVTNMDSMFRRCSALTSLDVSSFNTSRVTTMAHMFRGCSGISSFNLNNFDTKKVTNMSYMFAENNQIQRISLGSFETPALTNMQGMFMDDHRLSNIEFNTEIFTTSNVTDMSHLFEGCYDIGLTGPLSVLRYLDTHNVTDMSYMFSEIGRNLRTLDLSSFDTSSLTNMSHMFYRNSLLNELNLSSFDTSKVTDMTSAFEVTTPSSPNSVLRKVILSDAFDFKGNGITDVSQQGLLPAIRETVDYTGYWVLEGDETGSSRKTSEELRDSTVPIPGTWVWEKKNKDYTIKFTAEEGADGYMSDATAQANQSYKLPKNRFVKIGYDFDHWDEVDVRRTYDNEATIPANTYSAGSTVTLKAVFEKRDTSATVHDGWIEIILHGGEMAVIDGLPAGLEYLVMEDTPEGWVLIYSDNVSGVIEPLVYSTATFINKYQPDQTTARIYGIKMLDNRSADPNSFWFELLDENGDIIQTKPVGTGGFVLFDVITYTKADIGEHVYTVREIDPEDDTIDYDTHPETVTVTVTQNPNGTLSAEVEYDEDGVLFINKRRPGTLRITKVGDGVTDANKDDVFTFKITFTNADGMPLGDGEEIYWYLASDSIVGRTQKVTETALNNAKVNEEKETASGGGKAEALPLRGNPLPLNIWRGINTPSREDVFHVEDHPELSMDGQAYA
ncbi:MAG: BspA family leucine-rich repeat surface protein, partial [Erysipelotrichaceae bacterium]|nr:BspA family leucine-rich repeat surface protein [Erysipelotrichaceae bacterium]